MIATVARKPQATMGDAADGPEPASMLILAICDFVGAHRLSVRTYQSL